MWLMLSCIEAVLEFMREWEHASQPQARQVRRLICGLWAGL